MILSDNNPLVSLLIVSYNHSKWILETLESVRNQTYKNLQIVIIDDCSSDNTVEIIQNWIDTNQIDCTFIAHKENQGVCKTYNEGVGLCDGKYYSSVSGDDILNKNKTEKQVAFFENQDDSVAMIYSDAVMFFEDNLERKENFIEFHRKDNQKPSGKIFEELLHRNFIPGMSSLVRKSVFNELGGFDEDLIFEDYDLYLRIAKKYDINYLDGSFVKYRMHEANMHKSLIDLPQYQLSRGLMFLKHDHSLAKEQLKKIFNLADHSRKQTLHIRELRATINKMNELYHKLVMSMHFKVGKVIMSLFNSKKARVKLSIDEFSSVYRNFMKEKKEGNP